MAAFEFGPFLLDPAKRSLLRDGIPQPLTPKAFDLLALLVRHRARVLSKEELLSTLWPETFVEEANLSQQIFVIRRTLNGDSESAEYIATIPRRGYRFTAQVIERSEIERLAESAPNEPTESQVSMVGPIAGRRRRARGGGARGLLASLRSRSGPANPRGDRFPWFRAIPQHLAGWQLRRVLMDRVES